MEGIWSSKQVSEGSWDPEEVLEGSWGTKEVLELVQGPGGSESEEASVNESLGSALIL